MASTIHPKTSADRELIGICTQGGSISRAAALIRSGKCSPDVAKEANKVLGGVVKQLPGFVRKTLPKFKTSASRKGSSMSRRHHTRKMTRAQKRAANRAAFRAKRAGRGKRRGSRRHGGPRLKRYSKKAYTRFGRRRAKRHHASSLKYRPSLAALSAMNRELGINPRRKRKGKKSRRGRGKHRPSKCWPILRKTRRKLYSRKSKRGRSRSRR